VLDPGFRVYIYIKEAKQDDKFSFYTSTRHSIYTLDNKLSWLSESTKSTNNTVEMNEKKKRGLSGLKFGFRGMVTYYW